MFYVAILTSTPCRHDAHNQWDAGGRRVAAADRATAATPRGRLQQARAIRLPQLYSPGQAEAAAAPAAPAVAGDGEEVARVPVPVGTEAAAVGRAQFEPYDRDDTVRAATRGTGDEDAGCARGYADGPGEGPLAVATGA